MSAQAIALENRGILHLEGPDMYKMLQGIITNDVEKTKDGSIVYAALLTPQGKYLFDFFLVPQNGALLLDCEADRLPDLQRRLMMYRLRSKVGIRDVSQDWRVWAIIGENDLGLADPRHENLGRRLVLPVGEEPNLTLGTLEDYERHRLSLGIPDGSRDIEVERTLILEANLEPLHGVDFDKGCYVGQELTARMKHRGKVRKRLIPVDISGAQPETPTPLTKDDKDMGEMRSILGTQGLALLRVEDLHLAPFQWGDATISPRIPDWLSPYVSM